MKVDFKNFEEYQSKLGLVFHGTLAVPLLPFALLFLEIKNRGYQGMIEPGMTANVINYAVALVSGLLVAQGFNLLKRKIYQVAELDTLKAKLQLYYSAAVPLYIFVSVACLFLAAALWITTGGVIIVAFVIVLFVMSLNRPTPARYVKILKLNKEEKDIIINHKDQELT
jgi:hypothetical protein